MGSAMKKSRKKLIKELANALGLPADIVWPRLEIIGDIALIRKPVNLSLDDEKLGLYVKLGERLLEEIDSVKSVWLAASPVSILTKTRDYVFLAGENRSETVYREHGCRFKLDIRKVYVSPRLSHEHGWFAGFVEDGDRILNMFAGVGFFSIIPACKKRVSSYAIDINPHAYQYMVENISINKVDDRVFPLNGDSCIIAELLREDSFDHVIMPYPEKAIYYIPLAMRKVKPGGYIHLYVHTDIPRRGVLEKIASIVSKALRRSGAISFELTRIREVRTVGPRYGQYTVTVKVWRKKPGWKERNNSIREC